MGVAVGELLIIDAMTFLVFFSIFLFISELELKRCEVGVNARVL